jgi:heat shock protein HtpX
VKHRDTLISTVSAIVAGAISSIAHFGLIFGGRDEEGHAVNPLVGLLALIVAPFAAMLIQFAISRAREFEADRGGAAISGDPQALASALEKMERFARGIPLATAHAHPETAQMMIVNPLSGGGLAGLFSTHPETGERVRRLLNPGRKFVTY